MLYAYIISNFEKTWSSNYFARAYYFDLWKEVHVINMLYAYIISNFEKKYML